MDSGKPLPVELTLTPEDISRCRILKLEITALVQKQENLRLEMENLALKANSIQMELSAKLQGFNSLRKDFQEKYSIDIETHEVQDDGTVVRRP